MIGLVREIFAQPAWLVVWVVWLIVVNTACLLFLRHVEARWVLGAWIGNVVTMSALYELNGFNRLLGLSHVVWWTPLLVWLWRRRSRLSGRGAYSTWIWTLAATNAASLVIDYVDVFRYLSGER